MKKNGFVIRDSKWDKFCSLRRYGFLMNPILELDLDGDYFTLYVYEDGFDLPVFHVVPLQNYQDICVCFFEPRYFQYTHSRYLYDTFVLELFDEALRQPYKDHPEYTVWEYMVLEWEFGHEKLPKKYHNMKQPDYTKLEDKPMIRRSFAHMLKAKWYA